VSSEFIAAHFLAEHIPLDITTEHCVGCLIDGSDDFLTYGRELNQISIIYIIVINLY